MGRYAVGYRLERRVQHFYAKYGWLVTRFPKSGRQLYPADVIALKRINNDTHIHLIECKNMAVPRPKKNTIYIEREQIMKLQHTANQHQALALVAYSFPFQHPRILHIDELRSSGKMLYLERNDGVSINRFLSTFR